jgi:release factor glutamine methyltransferase
MTIHEAYRCLCESLYSLYDLREAETITDWVMEHITGWKKTERIINKDFPLSETQQLKMTKIEEQLLLHQPVQYVLQEAWFMGLRLHVDERVLIPRPETEELVNWVVEDFSASAKDNGEKKLRILDVGTGSGCIAIALSRKITAGEIWGCDINTDTLAVAKQNAATQQAAVQFIHLDFLESVERKQIPAMDLIISNPPYISLREKEGMATRVTAYEPAQALFVPNEDPLIFYRAIADFGETNLLSSGAVYVEIHEDQAGPVMELFLKRNWKVILRKDMFEKDRMIKAWR